MSGSTAMDRRQKDLVGLEHILHLTLLIAFLAAAAFLALLIIADTPAAQFALIVVGIFGSACLLIRAIQYIVFLTGRH